MSLATWHLSGICHAHRADNNIARRLKLLFQLLVAYFSIKFITVIKSQSIDLATIELMDIENI